MKEKLGQFWLFTKKNKGKFFLLLLSTLIFLFMLFPFNDLGDMISSKIAKLTNNKINLQFKSLHLSFLPSPGIQLDEMNLSAASMPTLQANEVVLSPSITSLFSKRPHGNLELGGFLKGKVEVKASSGKRSESGNVRDQVELKATDISLLDLKKTLSLPIQLRGKLDANTTVLADLTFKDQPEADLAVTIKEFEFPSQSVNLALGPMILPNLKLSNVILKGRLSGGNFVVETGTFGKDGDELIGSIQKGSSFELKVINAALEPTAPAQMKLQAGFYNFNIIMNVKKSLIDRAPLVSLLLEKYGTPAAGSIEYKFNVSGAVSRGPGTLGSLR